MTSICSKSGKVVITLSLILYSIIYVLYLRVPLLRKMSMGSKTKDLFYSIRHNETNSDNQSQLHNSSSKIKMTNLLLVKGVDSCSNNNNNNNNSDNINNNSLVTLLKRGHDVLPFWSMRKEEDEFFQEDLSVNNHENKTEESFKTNTGTPKNNTMDIGLQSVKRVIFINEREGNSHTYNFRNCDVTACEMTQRISEADLVMVNAGQMQQLPTLPEKTPNQIWMMYTREAAVYSRLRQLDRPDLNNIINWTAAIYDDATYKVTYGTLVRRTVLPDKNYERIFDSKRYEVAWFVSHCETYSLREKYVARMLPWVDVHIYGSCGNYTCGSKGYTMGGFLQQCLQLLDKHYKFYLAFENSLCENYITEKFFNLFRNDVDIIPVVRGGADDTLRLPSAILINTRDFKNPEQLAKHLRQLSQDKTRYIRLLKNKNRYTIGKKQQQPLSCFICKSVHSRQPMQLLKSPHEFYANISRRCHKPMDLD